MHLPDFHAHILPGADHGSDSVATSLAQLRLAKAAGIDRIFATSHYYPHVESVAEFLTRRNAAYRALMEATASDPGAYPDIRLGAEALCCHGMEHLPDLEKLCVYGTNVILLELPFTGFSEDFVNAAYAMTRAGIRVVLAHTDRYPKEDIERMLTVDGIHMQLNAEALAGLFPKRHLFGWMERGLVVALGSDIHKADAKAYARFLKAEKRLGTAYEGVLRTSGEIFTEADPFPWERVPAGTSHI